MEPWLACGIFTALALIESELGFFHLKCFGHLCAVAVILLGDEMASLPLRGENGLFVLSPGCSSSAKMKCEGI